MSEDFIFTSESVTHGHPDKLCDQISDAIVDAFLTRDPASDVAAECAISSQVLFIAVRYASSAKFDIPDIARGIIRNVGYPRTVLDADACTILTNFIDQGEVGRVGMNLDDLGDSEIDAITASRQVTVFGYACDQTPTLMPMPVVCAHRLAELLDSEAIQKRMPYLLPDAQTQVGIEYHKHQPHRVHSVTLAASHADPGSASLEQLRNDFIDHVMGPVFADLSLAPDENTLVVVNPDGVSSGGGPSAHSGLTGRKTGVDTYGEFARHSGAALSGKDPMRIDRVGAYAARYAAKNVVAAKLARECEVTLSYGIGFSEPVSVRVRTFGTSELGDDAIAARVEKAFDFRPAAIVRDLRLRSLPAKHDGCFYQRLATYGHMGRTDLEVPWEKTNKQKALK